MAQQKTESKPKADAQALPPKANFSEWFTQICSPSGAGLADVRYGIGGLMVHLPPTMRITRKLYEYFETEVENRGHEPVLFPTMIKEANLVVEKEHAGFTPEVFWVESAGSKPLEERLALRPTGETQIYPMFSLWLNSYNQLPFRIYQSRHTVFRNEMSTRPFLRGREFLFFETHNCYEDHESVMAEIAADMATMNRVIWGKLSIPHLFLQRPQWDKFKGAENTYVADCIMPDGKRNQISSTHDLGQRFSKAYDIKVLNANKENEFVHQSCFGPGIWRIMAALIGIHGDDQGLILPFELAPVQLVVVPIFKTANKEKVLGHAQILADRLKQAGYRVTLDERDKSPGFKYNDWEMRGVPVRIEFGERDLEAQSVMLKVRNQKEKATLSQAELLDRLPQLVAQHDQTLRDNAQAYFADKVNSAETLEDAIRLLDEKGGFVKVPFHGIGFESEAHAKTLQEKTGGAYVCGVKFGEVETESLAGRTCIITGAAAGALVYIARSH
ncbi:MAG: hypothetical protein A2600_09745 [Candidatus Lambdaproteobacteria bacterium RIFOXYD1_FULL_56_27]|uniref:proline--tRNA ligase n=1 Tax=Candidatus Lambdaproteobacteria bacterium RIFOXYD2_FULL_56_26 TaxID=1817773 RepID=A0A1F6GUT8_9PROT|nr:MAG: hypothetical protein A2557_05015 [Candidatus Lambdaproteobacteria bacterium RIFOXYD2_FULL_56_26]OGH02323.1 MAG: hypothetical protein A2426_03495 [Candidatus Lambdaproteobacteria bacterium RIFOXYC1_FULL_56_13]OGH10093.1 MAG: hypothetical protein A2600_09745 [Candidatus Lambdaproteobacteria bacterium RIFOXYD1_FULL_56_27]